MLRASCLGLYLVISLIMLRPPDLSALEENRLLDEKLSCRSHGTITTVLKSQFSSFNRDGKGKNRAHERILWHVRPIISVDSRDSRH